jgi:anti-sigma regulatory factor (Ser/Thr protein kinase)
VEARTVAGTLESLSALRDFVREAAEQAGLDNKATYRLVLAVDEVATNIITHGYDEAGLEGDVTIAAHLEDEQLTIVLEDSGQPFDPRGRDDPDNLDAPLEDRPIGGLGIYLTIQGIDHFDYEWAEGHNRNIFVMQRDTA